MTEIIKELQDKLENQRVLEQSETKRERLKRKR